MLTTFSHPFFFLEIKRTRENFLLFGSSRCPAPAEGSLSPMSSTQQSSRDGRVVSEHSSRGVGATWCLWVQTLKPLPWHHSKSPNLWPLRWNTSTAPWILSNILDWNLITRFNPSTIQTLVFWLDKCSLELWGFDEGMDHSWKLSILEGCNTHQVWGKEGWFWHLLFPVNGGGRGTAQVAFLKQQKMNLNKEPPQRKQNESKH